MSQVMHLVGGKPQILAECENTMEAQFRASHFHMLRGSMWIEDSLAATRYTELSVSTQDLTSTSKCYEASDWRTRLIAKGLSPAQLDNLAIFLRQAAHTAEQIANDQRISEMRERLANEPSRLERQEMANEKRQATRDAKLPSAMDLLD